MSKTLKKSILLIIIALGILFLSATVVNAETMSDEFKSYLNEEGEFEINSAIPTSEDYFALMVDKITYDEEQNWLGLMFTNVATDYSEVDLTINAYEANEEKHRVKLQWNYDETANKKIQNFMKTTLKEQKTFNVKDLELVNYWYNRIKNNYKSELIMFSGELKSALNYGNIDFEVSTRGGGSAPFKSETIGFAYFGYNGSIYNVVNGFGASADHIMYVPSETENDAEAIRIAAQKRIDDYIGKTDMSLEYVSTAWEYWVKYFYNEMKDEWMKENPGLTLEQFEQMGNAFMPTYPSFEEGFESELGLAGVHKDDLVYMIDIPIDENMGDCKKVIIRRDSSKMVNPVLKTADLSTDIQISTNKVLPLDTIIQAKELTSDSEYEKMVEKLNLTDNLIFDIALYSKSLDKNITQLDNEEKFEVKIPIPENFKGKDLVAYYVPDNGLAEVYNVEIKNGYAIFETKHFSVYTLGYKNTTSTQIKVTFDANGGKFGNENIYTIDNWTADLYDSLIKPTSEGYTFKGYYTEKIGGTKFEMILNESGIDKDMTFYAQWEEDSGKVPPIAEEDNQVGNINTGNTTIDKNPKTGDNILFFVGMLFVAVIGIIVTTKIGKYGKNK